MNFRFLPLIAVIAVGCQSSRQAETVETKHEPSGIVLRDGLGPVSFPISTSKPNAQRFFNQGVAYLYGFNHDAARRSFERAAQVDPQCAMAYWGQALVIGPNYNLPDVDRAAIKQAHELVEAAKARQSTASPRERAYIDALSQRYSADDSADVKQLQHNYAQAMAQLAKRFQFDLDAATLAAESYMNLRPWKLYDTEGNPAPNTDYVVTMLEWVLTRNPDHIGANHYYIHATEASKSPERAMACAQRLPRIAPASGHLVHMPAHVYIRTGQYAEAVRINELAVAADEQLISCCGPKGIYPAFYFNHNLHFLANAACFSGQSKLALAAANKIGANLREAGADVPAMVEPFLGAPILVKVRFNRWEEILAEPKPADSWLFTNATWHFARGMAHIANKDASSAQTELDALTQATASMDERYFGQNTAKSVAMICQNVLDAKLKMINGDTNGALASYRAGIKVQDALSYDEPPPFPIPVREFLGEMLMSMKEHSEAEKVFRADLERNRNNPRSLLGLAETLLAQNKTGEAESVRKMFGSASAAADMEFTFTR